MLNPPRLGAVSQFPKVEEDQLQLLSFTPPLGRAACRLGVSACAWVVCVRTHMRVVKMAAIARTVRTENALALQRSSFRENPTYFLTSVRRWVCELVFDAIYDWISEFSHNRQTDRQTDKHDNYSNPRCACAPRVNDRQTRQLQ